MTRGSIIRVNLEDGHPPEFGKTRPAVIISNDEANTVLPTVVVIPLSTRPPEIPPLRIQLPEIPGLQQSYAVVPGIRQISKERVEGLIAEAPADFVESLQTACFAYLSD
jgi:mRNA interferase MazF